MANIKNTKSSCFLGGLGPPEPLKDSSSPTFIRSEHQTERERLSKLKLSLGQQESLSLSAEPPGKKSVTFICHHQPPTRETEGRRGWGQGSLFPGLGRGGAHQGRREKA